MSPVSAFAGDVAAAKGVSARATSADKRTTNDTSDIRQTRIDRTGSAAPALSGGDLRTELDGLGFPLLIKGAILGWHGERVAGLHSLHHAFRQGLQRRVRRWIDELRRLRERSVRLERQSDAGEIGVRVGRLRRRLPASEIGPDDP